MGTVMPPISGTLTLSAAALKEITMWCAALRNQQDQSQQRAVVAAQFLHQALLEQHVQQFISYFIVLDALFGERGSVEQNVIAGVQRLDSNRSWQTRCGFYLTCGLPSCMARSAAFGLGGNCPVIDAWVTPRQTPADSNRLTCHNALSAEETFPHTGRQIEQRGSRTVALNHTRLVGCARRTSAAHSQQFARTTPQLSATKP